MTYLGKLAHSAVCALTVVASLATVPNRAQAGSEPYLGDIMIVGFNFCPRGWAQAAGQILPINQNSALYSLLGTTFGGDGQVNFGLPDLRGRVTMGPGAGPGLTPRQIGEKAGTEAKTMTEATMGTHSHMVNANNLDGDKPGPSGNLLAAAPTGGTGNETIYSTEQPNRVMNATMIENAGASAGISTQDPFLGLLHCIATTGNFPPRS
ncbi:MAG: tail fiber protein [Sulfitobacter sp.]